MPYESIEQIQTRGYEKIAQFLTVQQLFGVMALLLPGIAVTTSMDGLMRFVVLALCVLLGYLLATEVRGMAPYQRVFWRVRGVVGMAARGRTLEATDLPGTVSGVQIAIQQAGGPIRRVSSADLAPLPVARPKESHDAAA